MRTEVLLIDEIWMAELPTPYGNIAVAATRAGLMRIAFSDEDRSDLRRELAPIGVPRDDPDALAPALSWLRAAIANGPSGPPPPCDLRLVQTTFAHDVLAAIGDVPPGETISYAELASAAGRPRAVRAAAHVCARNPLPVVIGCHRIVRSDGTIGRYRGGTALKAHLLSREAAGRPLSTSDSHR